MHASGEMRNIDENCDERQKGIRWQRHQNVLNKQFSLLKNASRDEILLGPVHKSSDKVH